MNLSAGTATGEGTDTIVVPQYSGGIVGSAHDDLLVGTSGNDRIQGGGGDDRGGGPDNIVAKGHGASVGGGGEVDYLWGGVGVDIHGGGDVDSITSFVARGVRQELDGGPLPQRREGARLRGASLRRRPAGSSGSPRE